MCESALLVVDAQIAAMAASINAAQTITNVSTLVSDARRAAVPVIWVQHESNALPRGGADWQLVPELEPRADEPIVHKAWADAFVETDLGERLADLGAREVVLCGAQTDACIRSTFYGGIHRGYDMTLVADAHTTEDLREYGAQYTPEQSIAVLNLQAAYTSEPGARGAVTMTEDAFAGAGAEES